MELRGAAATGDNARVQELLLDASASVNHAGNNGVTALMYAGLYGHNESIELLLGASASVDEVDNYGRIALMCAQQNRHSASIELLLGASAPVDHTGVFGTTALMYAARLDGNASIALLLGASASVDHTDDKGCTALMCASLRGHSASIELLLGASASVDQAGNGGRTALMFASRNNHHTTEDLLRSWTLLSPLMMAVVLRNPVQVRALLHLGAGPMHTVELPSGTHSAWSLALNDPPQSWAKEACTETMQLAMVRSSLTWSQESHSLYPPRFRRGVRHLLALRQANKMALTGNHLCKLPEPLLMLIISHLARNWSE